MDKKILEGKIAYLETINDQLETEKVYVDALLRAVGFANGLETVKRAAEEAIEESEIEDDVA